MSETEIKPLPCPKCHTEITYIAGGNGYRFINCPDCMISNDLAASMMKFDKVAAIEDWNDYRSPIKPLEASGDEKLGFAPIKDCLLSRNARSLEKIQSLQEKLDVAKELISDFVFNSCKFDPHNVYQAALKEFLESEEKKSKEER